MTPTSLRGLGVGRDPSQRLVGVEHELQAWGSHGQHDFRRLIGAVAGQVSMPDPGDPRARRLSSGMALTADGWEAELITPPLPAGRTAQRTIVALLERETGRLHASLRALDSTVRLLGFSTHVNVTVADGDVVRVAHEFARRCSVAAMLLMDGPERSGQLVRPRRGRLEVCGDYLTGEDLAAAVVFVSAATAMLSAPGGSRLPLGGWGIEPARERFGHFVPPLEDRGSGVRSQRVPLADGRRIDAQSHLETIWAAVRPHALGLGLDPAPVDERVAGRSPMPAERGHRPAAVCQDSDALDVLDPASRSRRRGNLELTPAWLTWTTVAWRCNDTVVGGSAHIVLPVPREAAFLRLLDSGQLDRMLVRAVRRPLPVLERSAQASRPGLWSDIRPEALVPAERGPTGLPTGSGAGGGDRAKDRRDEARPEASRPDSSRPAPRPGRPRPWWAVVAGALLVLGAGATAAMLNGAGSPDVPAAVDGGSSPTSPPATQTTAPTPTSAITDPANPPAAVPAQPAMDTQSISYVGTLTTTSEMPDDPLPPSISEGMGVGIFCRDEEGQDCRITGLSGVNGWDFDGLVRTSPGSFSASYRDDAYSPCDDFREGTGPPTDVAVTLEGDTMRMVVTSQTVTSACTGDVIEASSYGGTSVFEGTYESGSIPGWEP